MIYNVYCTDTPNPDLIGLSESDPCYYIIKYNVEKDSVLFCELTRGKWDARNIKHIITNESICTTLFHSYANLTLHDVKPPQDWIFMKECVNRYNTVIGSRHNHLHEIKHKHKALVHRLMDVIHTMLINVNVCLMEGNTQLVAIIHDSIDMLYDL